MFTAIFIASPLGKIIRVFEIWARVLGPCIVDFCVRVRTGREKSKFSRSSSARMWMKMGLVVAGTSLKENLKWFCYERSLCFQTSKFVKNLTPVEFGTEGI